MAYLVFARKWRPQVFEEVVGQNHVTQTLKNAISTGRVGQAYLFAGPRGVGKTTTARILAKAINCEKGPIPQPCNKCTFCKEISGGNSIDVLEIDGASNRRIDEIRDLRMKARYVSVGARYKIYIIDEVHMLTTEAFNALLKTLEEPPPHLIFIFATTEPHKVPLTILSRCQRFNFRLLSLKDIVGCLKDIVHKEALEISEEALFLIARSAEGSMRDGQTILDQVLAFTGKKIEANDVRSMLGIVEQELYGKLGEDIAGGDIKDALLLIDKIVNGGYDLTQFIKDLRGHFRNLTMAKVSGKPEDLIDLPAQDIEKIVAQAKKYSLEKLLEIIKIISETEGELRRSVQTRVILEMAIIKLTKLGLSSSFKEIDTHTQMEENKIAEEKPDFAEGKPSLPKEKPSFPEQKPSFSEEKPDLAEEKPAFPEEKPDLAKIKKIWPLVIEGVKKEKPSLGAYLQEGELSEIKGNTLILTIRNNFHKENIEDSLNKKIIEEELKKILSCDLKFCCHILAGKEEVPRKKLERTEEKDFLLREPIIKTALEMFKGKIVEIKN